MTGPQEREPIRIGFGALCDPIGQQLREQGINLPVVASAKFQGDADAITRLYLRGLLTESETVRARKRLMKAIIKAVRRAPHPERTPTEANDG